jgi:hypothetical protein
LVPLQPLNRQQVQNQINQLRASGGTPLGMRMKEATDELLKMRAKDPYGDYRLLVVTDGEASDQDVLSAVLPDIMRRSLLVDVIGVDMQSEHTLATQVSNYRRADDPDSLEKAIAESLAESDDSKAVGGQSDFELLSLLPVDLAPAVISALTTTDNGPIGEKELANSDGDGASIVFYPQGGSGGRGGSFKFGGIFCMIALFRPCLERSHIPIANVAGSEPKQRTSRLREPSSDNHHFIQRDRYIQCQKENYSPSSCYGWPLPASARSLGNSSYSQA